MPPAAFGNLLQHFTGSKAHNVAMREDAVKRGLKVSEWGVETVETGEVFQTDDEDEVYRHLGYEPVPPEIREGTVELARARAGTLPALVEVDDIRGDLHVHTNASDGKATLEEMVDAARASGLDYLAITDHSAGVGMGIGLEPDALPRHLERIREHAATLDGFTLLTGVEVDVMVDGSLYYDDELLAQVDWVVASLHVGQRQDSERATSRMLAAIENPYVDVIAHPSGRLLGRRDGLRLRHGGRCRGGRAHGHLPRDQLRSGAARPAAGAREGRDRGGRQDRDLDRRPPHDVVRPPRARRRDGATRVGDRRRHREHARVGRARSHAQAALSGTTAYS